VSAEMKVPTAKDLRTKCAKAIHGKSVTSEPPNSLRPRFAAG